MKIFICPIILTCLILSACATKTIEHNQAEIEILNPKAVTPYEDPMGISNDGDMHLYYDAVAQTKIELGKIVDMMKKVDHSDSVEVFLMGNLDDGTQLINGIAPEGPLRKLAMEYRSPLAVYRWVISRASHRRPCIMMSTLIMVRMYLIRSYLS